MKTRIVLCAALIGLMIYGVGCGKGEKQVIAGPPPTGPVELKLKWPAGSRTIQDTDVKLTMDLAIPGRPPTTMDVTMGQKYECAVLKEHPDGGHDVQLEFLSMRMSLGQGNQSMQFDTSQKGNNTPLGQAFEKFVGSRLTFFLDASNEVFKIDGLEEFKKQVAAAKDPTGMVSALLNEGQLKLMIEGQSKGLPPGPVSPGDQWPVQIEIETGQMGTFVADFNYTFKEWERRNEHNCARIALDGTMKTRPGQTLQVSGMKVSTEGGKCSGETWFDFERGMTVETVMSQDMTMYMTTPADPRRGAAGRPQVITNHINQVINIKAAPKE